MYIDLNELEGITNLGKFNDTAYSMMYCRDKSDMEKFFIKRMEKLGKKGMYPYILNTDFCNARVFVNSKCLFVRMEDGDTVGLFLKSMTLHSSSRASTDRLVKMAIEPISLNDNEENVKKVINKLISVGYIVKIQLIEEELDKYKKYLETYKSYDEDFYLDVGKGLEKMSTTKWRTKNYIRFFEGDSRYIIDYDFNDYVKLSGLYDMWAKNWGVKRGNRWIKRACESMSYRFVSVLYDGVLLACHVIDPVFEGKHYQYIANFSMGMLSEEEIREYMGDKYPSIGGAIRHLRCVNKFGMLNTIKYMSSLGVETFYLGGCGSKLSGLREERLFNHKTSMADGYVEYFLCTFKDGAVIE